jgi:hypothetical protein
MTLDRAAAASSLAAIEQTEQRTSRAIFYGIASAFLILWGVVTAVGYVATQAYPRQAAWTWPVLTVFGYAVTLVLVLRQRTIMTPVQRLLGWRLILAQVALIGFGVLVAVVLGPFSGRQFNAFWPLVFMLGYVLAGIWVGRFFILCGVAVALLTVAGFWWSGTWFPLWMAVVNGGSLILGGLWLRRQGVQP